MTNCWHVLGAGAIGSLFAASLHRAGIATTVLCRSGRQYERLRDKGIDISIDRNGITETITFPVSDNAGPDAISHLLVTTKAYDVLTAVSEVAHRLSTHSHIILLVNGLGFMDDLQSSFPGFQFTVGTTTEGAYALDPEQGTHHFCHAGNGLTQLGQTNTEKPPPWFDDWAGIDLPCIWETDIEQSLWRKLAINCAINPLCALHGCKNGELSERPELAKRVHQLCDEIALVSVAAGFQETANNIHCWVNTVITETCDNRSSMLQDVLAGRRTENEYITGYFLKLAKQYGVTTPYSKAAYEGILQSDRMNN